ncbi:hypothetical protein CY35_04G008200 [Sphagnum magellanicum]|jgi:hypothetical protein|nr:hypothetical protein CY35_04G008200 [Sphagnum magellanicum]
MADGFLEKLWDDVLAGPQPDKGLKKLRKKTMEQQQPSDDSALPDGTDEYIKRMMDRRRSADFPIGERKEVRSVAQGIDIKKKTPTKMRHLDVDSSPVASPGSSWSSLPASPSTSTPPGSWRSVFQHGRNRGMEGFSSERFDGVPQDSPTVHDWIVISALDR